MWQPLTRVKRSSCARLQNQKPPSRLPVRHPVNWEHKMVLPVAPYRLPIISPSLFPLPPSLLYRMYSIPFHPPLVRYLFRLSPISSSLAFTKVARELSSESGSELMSKLDVWRPRIVHVCSESECIITMETALAKSPHG